MNLRKYFIGFGSIFAICTITLTSASMAFADTTIIVSQNGTGTNNTDNIITTPTPTQGFTTGGTTSTNTVDISNCSENLQGYLEYQGNHLSDSHVIGHFSNSDDADCQMTIHIFGSNNQQPETDNWLESQTQVTSQTYTIPAHSEDYKVEFDVQNGDYCWYQIDATRTTEVRTPPYYSGTDMIDYVFVQGTECNCTPTPTLTPSVTVTPTATPTATETPTPSSSNNTPSSESNQTTPTPAVLGESTMASTGTFATDLIEAGMSLGSAFTIFSLWKQFRKNSR